MQTFLNVPGAMKTDDTIPEKDLLGWHTIPEKGIGWHDPRRISLVMKLEEARWLEHILCIVENTPISGLDRTDKDVIRDMRRSLKLARS